MVDVRKIAAYIAVVALVGLVSTGLGVIPRQSIALTAFVAIVMGALLYWRFRVAFALVGIGILFGAGLLDIKHFIEFAGFDIILFLIATMMVIGFLEERRFFEVLLEKLIAIAGASAKKLIVFLMVMAAVASALVGEVTSILFVLATVIHLTGRLRLPVVPLLIMTVFATNVGSNATVIGNPIGVLIALRAGLTFLDFIRWAAPISAATLALTIFLCLLYYRGYIREMDERLKQYHAEKIVKKTASGENPNKIDWLSLLIFGGMVAGLVMHSPLEDALGLERDTMLIGVPVIFAGIVLFLLKDRAREFTERRVDWWTLSFFFLFFATVGTLEFTGVAQLMSESIFSLSGGDFLSTYMLVGWTVGFMTAFMDNVLAVALWIPIVKSIGEFGFNIFPLWWAMLFAGTLMGNLTIIGSTANIVAVGMVERERVAHVTMRDWIVVGALVSFTTFLLSLILLYIQIPLMP